MKHYMARWWRFWAVCGACAAPCWLLVYVVPLRWAWVVAGPVSWVWAWGTWVTVGKRLVPKVEVGA
jgi:hypothetical protein